MVSIRQHPVNNDRMPEDQIAMLQILQKTNGRDASKGIEDRQKNDRFILLAKYYTV